MEGVLHRHAPSACGFLTCRCPTHLSYAINRVLSPTRDTTARRSTKCVFAGPIQLHALYHFLCPTCDTTPWLQALNRAVKALAVARKYVIDTDGVSDEEASTSGRVELSFQPLNRTNDQGAVDPNLFAFLAYKSRVAPGVSLLEHDETDLNVSQGSDPNAMANAIIRIVKERGQAVMKAGGGNALFVAMTAVVNARRRLKKGHGIDVMLVPQWITEDTRERLGRESKFLRFNILPCAIPGREVQEGTAAIAPLPPPPEPLPSCAASVVSMA